MPLHLLHSLTSLTSDLPLPHLKVREAALLSVSQLLSRLPYFSRQYYMVVEEMLLKLGEDDSEAVLTAIREKLMPALQVSGDFASGRENFLR